MSDPGRQRRTWWVFGAIGVLGLVGAGGMCAGGLWWVGGLYGRNWSAAEVQRSQAIGDGIIQAIEAYREARGVYPEMLDDLVPEYLPEVPPPVAGIRAWDYFRVEDDAGGQTYKLEFPGNSGHYPTCFYRPGRGWYVDE